MSAPASAILAFIWRKGLASVDRATCGISPRVLVTRRLRETKTAGSLGARLSFELELTCRLIGRAADRGICRESVLLRSVDHVVGGNRRFWPTAAVPACQSGNPAKKLPPLVARIHNDHP
jgi:hypothetical protein